MAKGVLRVLGGIPLLELASISCPLHLENVSQHLMIFLHYSSPLILEQDIFYSRGPS